MDDHNNQSSLELNQVMMQETPVMVSASEKIISQEKETSVGTIDEDMLSLEEKELVEKYADGLDISNVDQVVTYGVAAQRNISDFSVSVLKKVKTYDMGEIGRSLGELTAALDSTVEPDKKGILGIFKKPKQSIERIRANYEKADTNVTRIEEDLLKHESVLIQDISMYQQMYELNMEYYRELTIYIFAGKKTLERARSGKLSELKAKAEMTNKQQDIQASRDYEDLCYRFEKKLSDLELTRVISIQSAPQVRMLQNNDRELLDKLQSSIANTIPLWRNQLILSLGIEHTRRALDAQNTLTDKTNELLRRNSATLRIATTEVARASERPIADIETLNQCNRDLLTSLKDVVSIHEQGVIKRERAREQLVRIEAELKQAMKDVSC